MQRDLQPYEEKRGLPTLLLSLVLWIPWLAVFGMNESTWLETASPQSAAAALGGVGIALYALMFLLIFYRFPLWVKAHKGEDEARRWQYAEVLAGVVTGPITIGTVVQKLFRERSDLALGLAIPATVIVFALMLWLMVRHFPEACRWWRR